MKTKNKFIIDKEYETVYKCIPDRKLWEKDEYDKTDVLSTVRKLKYYGYPIFNRLVKKNSYFIMSIDNSTDHLVEDTLKAYDAKGNKKIEEISHMIGHAKSMILDIESLKFNNVLSNDEFVTLYTYCSSVMKQCAYWKRFVIKQNSVGGKST